MMERQNRRYKILSGKEFHEQSLLRMVCTIPEEKYNPPIRKRILVFDP